MKKKLLFVVIASVLAMTALTACGNDKGKEDVFVTDVDSEGNNNSVVEEMDPEIAVTEIAATLGMDGTAVDAADFFDIPDTVKGSYYMGMKTTCDSIGVFACPDADTVTEVSGVVDAYLASQKEEFQRYMEDEVYKFDDIYIYQDDTSYIFVLNGDKAAAADAVSAILK